MYLISSDNSYVKYVYSICVSSELASLFAAAT